MPNSRVLIAEDDPDIREAVKIRLHAAGYETSEARNGREAIDRANEDSYDAIVMDIRMPVMDGLSAIERLKSNDNTKRIPIVVSSASLPDRQFAIDAGAVGFIPKPHSRGQLTRTLSRVIDDCVASS